MANRRLWAVSIVNSSRWLWGHQTAIQGSWAHPARARRIWLCISDTGKHLDRAEHTAPENEQERKDVTSRRPVSPRPDRAPHTRADQHAYRGEVASQCK